MKAPTVFFILSFLLFLGCKPYYTVSNFEEITTEHKTVAVLPFEMIYSGKMPEGMTDEDLLEIEKIESKTFQSSFFSEILESTRRGKKPLRIQLQHYSKTNDLLEQNGITIQDSWSKNPEELAEILGVDAVVKAQIEKTRLFSDLASFGIEAGTRIVNILTSNNGVPGVPWVSNRNKTVQTAYALVDKNDGTTLWSINYAFEADWRSRSDELVSTINHKSARRFPYRVER